MHEYDRHTYRHPYIPDRRPPDRPRMVTSVAIVGIADGFSSTG